MKSLFPVSIALLLLGSCSEQTEKASPSKDFTQEGGLAKSYSENSAPTSIPQIESRKLIWTANLIFQVKDVEQSSSAIRSLCDKHDAFIADMRMNSTNYRVSNTLTIRVPNKQFNRLLESVKGESIFLDEASVNSNDVTEEYIDIESRLKTKREVRDRYIDILNTKTGSVKDIIEAEEAIRVITEEIEAKEGRLRYLQDQVSLSTITLELYQKVDYVAQPTVYEKPFSEEMSDSFSSGWSFFQHFFLSLITIWPLLVLLIAVGFWQRKRIKALIRKQISTENHCVYSKKSYFFIMKLSEKNKDFFANVHDVVRLIPAGRVTNYGAIAKYLGSSRSSRMVGWAMNAAAKDQDIPAHRVVNRNGLLTGKAHFHPPSKMQELLEKEGIVVQNDQIRSFSQHFWDPSIELNI